MFEGFLPVFEETVDGDVWIESGAGAGEFGEGKEGSRAAEATGGCRPIFREGGHGSRLLRKALDGETDARRNGGWTGVHFITHSQPREGTKNGLCRTSVSISSRMSSPVLTPLLRPHKTASFVSPFLALPPFRLPSFFSKPPTSQHPETAVHGQRCHPSRARVTVT